MARHGYELLSAAVILGVAALGAYIYLQSTRPAFACESLLSAPRATATPSVTPSPFVTQSPRLTPSPSPTPSPVPSPSPTPSPTPTPTPSPQATPVGSPSGPASATPSPSAIPTSTPSATPSPVPTPTPEPTPQLGFSVVDRGNRHVNPGSDTIRYSECPPTSGPHSPSPAKRGYYAPDQHLPVGAWVHSLEHGMVVVLYSCGQDGKTCPDQATLDALRQLADNAPTTAAAAACGIKNKIIVARFDQMSPRFAALGWDRAMLADTYDAAAFTTFYSQWVDRSPTFEAQGCDGPTGAD